MAFYIHTYLENTAVPAAGEAEGNVYTKLQSSGGYTLFSSVIEHVYALNGPEFRAIALNRKFFGWLSGAAPVDEGGNYNTYILWGFEGSGGVEYFSSKKFLSGI
ncbi:hypothetical protein [Microbulbifer epialgicus]|uniref:Uncharacterized protein n=1 Tax=Microbulbifer epialgicus TaxID=393907 RepID=A0ABV4P3Y8_9GAMM